MEYPADASIGAPPERVAVSRGATEDSTGNREDAEDAEEGATGRADARQTAKPTRRYQVVEGAANLALLLLTLGLVAATGIAAASADTVLGAALVVVLVAVVLGAAVYLRRASTLIADTLVDEEAGPRTGRDADRSRGRRDSRR